MRYVLEPTKERLHRFIVERDKISMILRSPSEDSLAILKLLEGLDDPHTSDLFWIHQEPFQDPKSYVKSIVSSFSTKHRMVKLALEQKEISPWPEIPPDVESEELNPVQRLRKLTMFSRDLLPVAHGGNSVWIFYPMQISNLSLYADFMQSLLEHEFPNPWCHHLRFIVREEPGSTLLSNISRTSSSIAVHEPDFGPAAVQRSLEREVNDDSIEIEDRLSSLVVLAGLDMAHGRLQESLEKYALFLEYYGARDKHSMMAVALNGMGEVYVRAKEEGLAIDAFHSALALASYGEIPSWQVYLNAAMNLAILYQSKCNWRMACGFWEVVRDTAIITRDASTKVRAMDQIGCCCYEMNERESAEASWLEGAQLAANIEDESLFTTMMERRREYYLKTAQLEKASEISRQLEAMQ